MALEAGSRLGPYEIVALAGSGDRGDVYKATDTRLNRIVALRTLPPDWTSTPDAKLHLDHDVQAIAALSHPNICALHDVGHAAPPPVDGAEPVELDFVVTEYLEGQTLAKRLERGALPLREAVKIAIELTDALDQAHQKGIVHRGLRPSNVMLCEGGVKLMDFGLAMPTWNPGSGPRMSMRTTKSHVLAADIPDSALCYMAPEQIEGTGADPRADIFAFGAMFYEMVTGAKAFEGKNRPMLIAAIASLDLDPLSKAKPAVPRALDHVAARCLEKDPDDRWQTAHDLNRQLRWIAEGAVLPSAVGDRKRRVLVAAAAVLLLAAGAATPAMLFFNAPTDESALQFRIPVYGLRQSDIAISPNGDALALIAAPDPPEGAALYVRPTNATTFRRVAGTEDASQPFWSADGRSIGFLAGGRLKKVDASGGPPQNIADAQGFTGGTWNSTGTIIFGSANGLFRVSAEGGKPEPITTVEKTESGHLWPSFLPDGRHYLYLAWSADAGSRALLLGTLDSKDKKRVMASESNVTYASPGYLLYHREATLFAQAWDAKALALTGQPLHVADDLAFTPTNGRGSFDASQNGVLLYFQGRGGLAQSGRANIQQQTTQYGWRDRKGSQLGVAGEAGPFGDIDLSPNGTLFAVTRQEPGAPAADVWVTDWQRGATTRLTLDPADDLNPVWSPDGLRVAFTTFRKGNADIFVKNANGVGADTPLLDTPANEFVEDWSKDGRYLAYKLGQETFEDIYALPLFGDKKPIPVVQGPFQKDEPQFSYDGKWMAYTSNESGAFQVYVIEFPGGKERRQVSTNGGGQPRWRRDGKELFYKEPDGAAMVVDITLGTRIESGVPRRLFATLNGGPTNLDPARHQWSVTPDGQRFLVRYPQGGARGGTLGGAGVPFNFAGGAAGQLARGGPRGNGGGPGPINNLPPSGLTIVKHWATLLKPQT